MPSEKLIRFLLVFVTIAVYAPVLTHDFINCDDPDYVTSNPHVQAGLTARGVAWAFSSSDASNWHPLTWLSHMLDCQLYGLLPAGHHFTNLLLHLANTLLLFEILRRMTGAVWRSALVAALFAWHPLHVESVAWVAERKDLLSTLLLFLTLGAWLDHARRCGNKGPGSRLFYCLTLICFALGLLAKPMLVTLPFLLLLLDFWPLRRVELFGDGLKSPANGPFYRVSWRLLLLEKVPFLVLSIMSSVITILVQKSAGSTISFEAWPFSSRLMNVVVSYVRYIQKIIWPVDLAVFYPMPASWPAGWVIVCGLAVLAGAVAAVCCARRRPYLTVGWFWFIGMLIPVIGLIQVGSQALADRYTYVPSIGVFIMLAWSLPEFAGKPPLAKWSTLAGVALMLAGCLFTTARQLNYWQDSLTLNQHALAVTTRNATAHVNEASALFELGRTDEAIEQVRAALAINPNFPEANLAMALALDGLGKPKDAIPYYRETLHTRPYDATALNNLAWILATNPDADIRDGGEAVKLAERACGASHYQRPFLIGTLAAAYAEAGRFNEAVETAQRAASLAESLGDRPLVVRNRKLLKLYRANRAYRE